MFKITGKIDNMVQSISYENENGNGRLEGDSGILFLVRWELENKSIVGPVGQYMEADINHPLAVYSVIETCFDSIELIEGEIPEADKIPEGCIG
ncbi:hypothetical protein D7X88_01615 [bacterium C-53]|nr:hypothetical protein [Lachnospiraceae bacterium]NBI01718.1 hypothetical protein [Lachnospiraceae bacterium]RKJ13004.1 hypothetical protein D7X88_01615 [bacterium C-53]